MHRSHDPPCPCFLPLRVFYGTGDTWFCALFAQSRTFAGEAPDGFREPSFAILLRHSAVKYKSQGHVGRVLLRKSTEAATEAVGGAEWSTLLRYVSRRCSSPSIFTVLAQKHTHTRIRTQNTQKTCKIVVCPCVPSCDGSPSCDFPTHDTGKNWDGR